jgi:tRNA threonylcarbamoyladenosine biosynthesis protein TsaE
MHAEDHSLTQDLFDEAATLALGARLAAGIQPGLKIFLEGDLGRGKTTLVRGLLQALGYRGRIKSPTYALVEDHVISELHFYHFDFYRLNRAEEFLDAGLDEYLSGQGVCLVEWPDKAMPYLPEPDVRIELEILGEGRRAILHATSERGRQCLTSLNRPRP